MHIWYWIPQYLIYCLSLGNFVYSVCVCVCSCILVHMCMCVCLCRGQRTTSEVIPWGLSLFLRWGLSLVWSLPSRLAGCLVSSGDWGLFASLKTMGILNKHPFSVSHLILCFDLILGYCDLRVVLLFFSPSTRHSYSFMFFSCFLVNILLLENCWFSLLSMWDTFCIYDFNYLRYWGKWWGKLKHWFFLFGFWCLFLSHVFFFCCLY